MISFFQNIWGTLKINAKQSILQMHGVEKYLYG